jgi:hypothetical protein
LSFWKDDPPDHGVDQSGADAFDYSGVGFRFFGLVLQLFKRMTSKLRFSSLPPRPKLRHIVRGKAIVPERA